MEPIDSIRRYLRSPLEPCDFPDLNPGQVPTPSSALTLGYYRTHRLQVVRSNADDVADARHRIDAALVVMAQSHYADNWEAPIVLPSASWEMEDETAAAARLLTNVLYNIERLLNMSLKASGSEFGIYFGSQESYYDTRFHVPPQGRVDHIFWAYRHSDVATLQDTDSREAYKRKVPLYALLSLEEKKTGYVAPPSWMEGAVPDLLAAQAMSLGEIVGHVGCDANVAAILPQLTKYIFMYDAVWNLLSDYQETLAFRTTERTQRPLNASSATLKVYHLSGVVQNDEELSVREMVFYGCLDALDVVRGRLPAAAAAAGH